MGKVPAAFILLISGGVLGGFFSTVIYSKWPRCPECGSPVKWYRCIPVISYFITGGRYTCCGWKIPLNCFFVEIAATLSSPAVLFFPPDKALWIWPIIMGSIFIAFMDIEKRLIHDLMPVLWFAWGIISVLSGFSPLGNPLAPLMGAFLCGAVLFVIRVVSGKKIGEGDVVLAIGVGGLLGPRWGMAAIAASFPLATALLLPLIPVTGVREWMKMKVPFAPFICISTVIFSVVLLLQ